MRKYKISMFRYTVSMGQQFGKRNKNKKRLPIRLLVLFLFSAIAISLILIVGSDFPVSQIQPYLPAIRAIFCVGIVLLCAAGIIYLCKERLTIYKTCLSAIFLIIFFAVVLWIGKVTDFIAITQSPARFEEFLKMAGVYVPLVYIFIQIIQVLFLPIPGAISVVAGLKFFGVFATAIYSLIGLLIGSYIAFFIGRKWGNKGASWLVGEEVLDRWKIKMKGKDNLLLTAMFLLPFFPDDVLCFVAGISTMPTRYFIWMAFITRAISVFSTCYAIRLIPITTWWGVLVWCILLGGMISAFILLYKNVEKVNAYIASRGKKKWSLFAKIFKKSSK